MKYPAKNNKNEQNQKYRVTLYFLILLLLVPVTAAAAGVKTLTGTVIGVLDGDTIKVRLSSGDYRVRLFGIDTPEISHSRKEPGQPYGRQAKKFTNQLVRKKIVTLQVLDTDRYGRLIALVNVDGINLNKELVKTGLTWVYRQYCKNSFCTELYQEEKLARQTELGMWSDPNIIPPWKWRKIQRKSK